MPAPPAPPSIDRMTVDLAAAERFLLENARLLDRHRYAHAFGPGGYRGTAAAAVVAALRAYLNVDGGFGHALEPDVRGPLSETTATLHGLEVLEEVGRLDEPMVAGLASYVWSVADADGGVPFVLPGSLAYPRGPWMEPVEGGSHLTFGLAAVLRTAGQGSPWLDAAEEWCWRRLAVPDELSSYWVKYALTFLDAHRDEGRVRTTIAALGALVDDDGSVPVAGGTEGERLDLLTLAPRPGTRSRALFTDAQVEVALDRLEAAQQPDGGWTFDWLPWSPAQTIEWRGLVTLRALLVLRDHGRLPGATTGA